MCVRAGFQKSPRSSASVQGQTSAPAAQPIVPFFGPFLGEKTDGGPVCSCQPEKLWCYVTSEALGPPCCCAPNTQEQNFLSFQIIWLQGSTQTRNRTNRKVIHPTWLPAERTAAAFQQAQSWKARFNVGN